MTEMIAVAVVDLKAGPALDWAVAKAVEANPVLDADGERGIGPYSETHGNEVTGLYGPSTDWSQGGPLLGLADLLVINKSGELSSVQLIGDIGSGSGVSPNDSILESICKAIVAAKFGDAVSVPKALWCGV